MESAASDDVSSDIDEPYVDIDREAGVVDVRETIPDEVGGFVGDVEEDAEVAGFFDLAVDRPRDDVSRCE